MKTVYDVCYRITDSGTHVIGTVERVETFDSFFKAQEAAQGDRVQEAIDAQLNPSRHTLAAWPPVTLFEVFVRAREEDPGA